MLRRLFQRWTERWRNRYYLGRDVTLDGKKYTITEYKGQQSQDWRKSPDWIIGTLCILLGAFSMVAVTLGGVSYLVAAQDYSRGDYRHWVDSDRDCLNTRHEVLAEESLVPPLFSNCKVVRGLWFDPYTGRTFVDPRRLDVDHLVPLAEAHRSGASGWSRDKKKAYANDLSNPGHLIAVEAEANRSKGARDPAGWLPSNESFRCAYVLAWVAVKEEWSLSMDLAEGEAVEGVLAEEPCKSLAHTSGR